MSAAAPTSFAELDLPDFLHRALADVGYETPSLIQAAIIPLMLAGADVLGQAQTGTGKTAAFALPLLARLDLSRTLPQALVLAPTRELAIQVAEAFHRYAAHLEGFRVLPLYGGADYRGQLRQLQRGVHVVVGTPGRVMDHMRRGSLDLSQLATLVLDEADEMLRMGFIEDVEWILQQTPESRQTTLFSATMPEAIRRIARTHLREPREVAIEVQTVVNQSIRQRVWMMAGVHKLDALTRILEVEDFDGIIIFVRTRLATAELAEKLAARGYATAALSGDVSQSQREATVERLKSGKLDILVATDVAARGLDVDRISHVINYDIPYDVETYVHRIGRTGRAGRHGEAILFAANRERRLLRAIERATGQQIEQLTLPSVDDVSDRRVQRFKQRIGETLATVDLDGFRQLVADYQHEHGVPVMDIAAALAAMANSDKPLFAAAPRSERSTPAAAARDATPRSAAAAPGAGATGAARERPGKRPATAGTGMQRYRIEVGRSHGVTPGNIVGAIANEAEIDAQYIGHIAIGESHSTVDLPEGMPKEVFRHLQKVWVCGRQLQLSLMGRGADAGKPPRSDRPSRSDKPARSDKPRKGDRPRRDDKRKPHRPPR
jgi:ATP-dependent RNA helicase DeaD